MQILIPVDDLAYSRASLHSIQQRKWPEGTKIVLARVIEDLSEKGVSEVKNITSELERLSLNQYDDLKETEKWLESLADDLKIENCEVNTTILRGDVTEQLANLANQYSIDYIVIGSDEKAPAKLNWLVSIASSITDRVSCSVEIVRPRILHKMLKEKKVSDQDLSCLNYTPSKIVIALDFSDNSLAALKWLCMLGCPSDTEVSLIAVEPPASKSEMEGIATKLDRQTELLENNFKAKISDTRVLRRHPADTILDYSKKWQADLIVLGAHGITGSDKQPMGSTTRHVMDGSDCSVVSINADNWSTVTFDWT